ncbi:hypothetical protein Rhe02_60830 [Rhizocola hellebori]|uniref:Uncharacterized protein n=1 Tax=Rhizocola hellebori TaxID=1392758 RepID=A0A8J3QEV5_9ACTN|nr:hypothetical protein [Rhizocola hellebori]GIH08016.1 hypothetical protein Rhe02_60830 [Rhizocola hellebori]
MAQASEEDKQKALKLAKELQASLDRMIEDERDNEALLEKLDRLAMDYRELAEAWDGADPAMATRVRQREEEIHLLRGRVETMAEMEADEAGKLKSAVLNALRQANPRD